jgi:hypothetical protein
MRSIRHAFRPATIAIAVVAIAAMPTAVFAGGRVETGTFSIEDHFVDTGASDACGFLVTDDHSGIGRYEVRFDAAGNATDVTIHSNTSGTISGNGVSLKQVGHDNLFIDLQTGGQMEAGIVFRVSSPGFVPAIFDRGRILFDGNGDLTFEAGPHPALDGDFSNLCAALGG